MKQKVKTMRQLNANLHVKMDDIRRGALWRKTLSLEIVCLPQVNADMMVAICGRLLYQKCSSGGTIRRWPTQVDGMVECELVKAS